MIEFQMGRSENRLSIQNELSDVNKGIRKQDIDKWQKFGWTMCHFMNLGLYTILSRLIETYKEL